MSSHIIIQNVNEIPLWGFRLMGFSDKDSDKIGCFGTGLKESIALLIRMGVPPIIYSGTCEISFKIEAFDGVDEIVFKLSENKGIYNKDQWNPMNMSPNLGIRDWNDAWMVFREIICNAIDESGVDNFSHDVISSIPEGIDGHTRIYIPCNKETLKAYIESLDRILLLLKPKIIHIGGYQESSVIYKESMSPMNIYHRGVWVKSIDGVSLYDYNLNGLVLTESRTTDMYDIDGDIRKILYNAPSKILEKIFYSIINNEKIIEEDVINTISTGVIDKSAWLSAYNNLYSNKHIICSSMDIVDHISKIKEKGYIPLYIPNDNLYKLLREAGVRNISFVLSESQQLFADTRTIDNEEHIKFMDIWNHMESLNLTDDKAFPVCKVFNSIKESNTLGYYMDGTCYINKSVLGSDMESLVIIEEFSHYISGYQDNTRQFQDFLLKCVFQGYNKAKHVL